MIEASAAGEHRTHPTHPSDPAADSADPAEATTEEQESGLVVVEHEGDQQQGEQRSEIDRPGKLLRLAGTVRGLLDDVRATELDEAGRKRLAKVHAAVLHELESVVSDDLIEELESMDVHGIGPDATGGELLVAQAQLAGWLEGLFHGIRASVANQQTAMLHQAQQAQQAQQPGRPQTGQYL